VDWEKDNLKIAFIDQSDRDYQIESAYRVPLGGSQFAICYLAEMLAQQGHQVLLFNNTASKRPSRGVICCPLDLVSPEDLATFDIVVEVNTCDVGKQIRPYLKPEARLALWIHHAHDQHDVEDLADPHVRAVYDGVALVSDWQRHQFHKHLGIEPTRSAVLRNGISPSFYGLFAEKEAILNHKVHPHCLPTPVHPFEVWKFCWKFSLRFEEPFPRPG
jgi:hypothetical protein